jgi:sec-independent protein translocase protein TatC
MSLIEHLEELRKRILWSLVFVAVAFFPCWELKEKIFAFLERPILDKLPPGTKLAYTGVVDPFILYFKVAALAAVFATTPFILFQIWRFIAPGLYLRERRYILPFVFFGTLFFLAGGAFAYYGVFPAALQYLLKLGGGFQPVITIERYFGLLLALLLGLGLIFELPILIFVICEIGLVTPRFLLRHYRYAVVIIFIAAAIITPTPDVLNMCLFALPALLLYLLGIAAAAISQLRKRRAQETAAAAG